MTLSPSAVTEALDVWIPEYAEVLAQRDDMQMEPLEVTAAAARSWVEGEEVSWCVAHASNLEFRSVHGTPMRCSHAWANDFDNCEFVLKRLCDGIDGGDR